MTWLKTNKIVPFGILTVSIVLFSLIPTVQTIMNTGAEWRGVPPAYVGDSLYYYARMKQVVNGYPFIGNPYFMEHRNVVAPAFFVPDWLYAVPILLGVSLTTAITFNFVFWSLLFAFLSFYIFRAIRLSRWEAVAGSIFLYLQSYGLLLRPVAMQQIFPFFLFFLLALILWLQEPRKTGNAVLLSLATAAPFYLYAYLWQVVVVVNIVLAGYLLFRRNKSDAYRFIIVNVSALVLAIPGVLFLFKQFSTPFYWDTMRRIGLVETHMPDLYAIFYARWIGVLLFIGTLLYFFLREQSEQESREVKDLNIFSFVTGGGLFIVMMSNSITGKELETVTHIGRFVLLWFAFCFVAYGYIAVKKRASLQQRTFVQKGILVVLFLGAALGLIRNFSESLPFASVATASTASSLQGYAAPLAWLDRKESTPVVIWADSLLSSYVPIVTKHYVLFAVDGGLHIESSQEVEERYLISKYFDALSVRDLEINYAVYAGVGNAEDQTRITTRLRNLCDSLQLYRFGLVCGEEVTGVSLRGQNYFLNLESEYKFIQENITDELKKFAVTYIIKDKDNDSQFHPEKIPGSTLVYDDGRFSIYNIK